MTIRRSELTTPGSDRRMMEKAAASEADEVMLDLEDAVAPSEKRAAREKIVDAIHEFDWGETVLAVRVNGPETPNFYRDVVEVVEDAGESIDVVIVPKVKRPEDVVTVDTLLSSIEANCGIDSPIGVEVLVEEVEALQRVDEIAAASDRLESLILGFGDFAASQGVDMEAVEGDGYPGDAWHYARSRTVVAARVEGIDAIDGPYPDFSDPDGYRRECERSAALGFVGKWAIHPSQIEIANDVYAPEPDEVSRARDMIEAMHEAQEAGRGAAQYDGEMIDEATLRQAEETVERARQIGMID